MQKTVIPERILIIGCCGSGKSTLAKRIYNKTKLPLIHLDKLYYKPEWQRTPQTEWEKVVCNLCKTDKWIMDGNYISSLPIRIKEAELIIFLDINRWLCLYRAILRSSISEQQRSDMADGCIERHSLELYRFIWTFNKIIRPRIYGVLEQHEDKKIYILKSRQDINQFLETL